MSFLKSLAVFITFCAVSLSSVHGQDASCPLQSVCFALDQSGSILRFFPKVKTLTNKIVDLISKRTSVVSYSAYGFSGVSQLIKKSTQDKKDFTDTIMAHRPTGGGTDIAKGLVACFNELKGQKGNRVIMLLTDGQGGDPLKEKPKIIAAGIDIVTVGVGSGVNVPLLKQLATKPEFFVKSNFGDLEKQFEKIVEKICKVVMMDGCNDTYQKCKFKFDSFDNVPTFKIGIKPDVPFTNRIVSKKNPKIGVLNTNGIDVEFLTEKDGFMPITGFGQPTLTPTHFKPFSLTMSPLHSGIGHQTFTGTQLEVSQKKCVRVFFSHFQLISDKPNPQVVGNVNGATMQDMNCVVFKTS